MGDKQGNRKEYILITVLEENIHLQQTITKPCYHSRIDISHPASTHPDCRQLLLPALLY